MILGTWFEKESSAKQTAELLLLDDSFQLVVDGKLLKTGTVESLTVSDRVGNISRKIYFSEDGVFHTQENDKVDRWLKSSSQAKHSMASGLFHRLETHWGLIAFSTVFVAVFSFSLVKWGIPSASRYVAHSLPTVVGHKVGEHSLEVMDELLLRESKLSEEVKEKIRQRFEHELAPGIAGDQHFALNFRYAGGIANAFALPSGDIVITDELVHELESDQQLDSVILHEMGHIYHRHGLTRVVHNSSISVLMLAVTGNDMTTFQEIAVGFPVFLLNQHYSRDAEAEADLYAFEKMVELNIDPTVFAEALEIITQQNSISTEENENKGTGYSEYISSHPDTKARMEAAKTYK